MKEQSWDKNKDTICENEIDCKFNRLIDIYLGRDGYKWSPVDEEGLFQQWVTRPPGSKIYMQKSKVTIQACFQAAYNTITNLDKREDWDNRLDENRVIY